MDFVREPEGGDSGLAVAAMLTFRTYLDALLIARHIRAWNPRRGMSTDGMKALVEALGAIPGDRLIRLPGRNPRNAPGHVAIKLPGTERVGRWLAWDGQRILDPRAPKPMSVSAWYAKRRVGDPRPSSYLIVTPTNGCDVGSRAIKRQLPAGNKRIF